MKPINIATILAILTLFLSVSVLADTTKTTKEKDAPKELINQTHCPVMGGKIDSAVYTDIQGQRVFHCCPMCSDKLKKDPDKYFEKAAEEGVLFENIQETCPVSGMKLGEKEVHIDHKGRRVYFCCGECIGAFNENPENYLAKLDIPAVDIKDMKVMEKMEGMKDMKVMEKMEGMKDKEAEKTKQDDHSDHNH